jgi:RNA polymerase sigma factor (sigma-70 family)
MHLFHQSRAGRYALGPVDIFQNLPHFLDAEGALPHAGGSSASRPQPLAFCKESPIVEITYLLDRAREGNESAREELILALYEELHDIAKRHMVGQPGNHTLQATALVNEAWMRLSPEKRLASQPEDGATDRAKADHWQNRKHFLSVASKAMRHVLVDHARRRGAIKRRAPGEQVPLDLIVLAYEDSVVDLEMLDRALTELAKVDPEMAEIVEMRFFGGREMSEIAAILHLPHRTLERRWRATRSWLKAKIK